MKIFVALVHLIFATTWLGSAFFYGVVLQPKLNTLPPAEQRALASASLPYSRQSPARRGGGRTPRHPWGHPACV